MHWATYDLPAALGLGTQGAPLTGAAGQGGGEREQGENAAIEHGTSWPDAADPRSAGTIAARGSAR